MSDFFPATYSTLQPAGLATLIAELYGFGRVSCSFIVRGVSDTYRISSENGLYILKVYRSTHRSLDQIRFEASLLLMLKQANVSVAAPVLDLQGKPVQEIAAVEGPRYGVLFHFAPGRVEQRLNDRKLENLGREIARFHNLSATIPVDSRRWSYNFETTLFQPLDWLKTAFETLPEEYAWWQRTADRSIELISRFNTEGFTKGYCHFDFLPKNFHFAADAVTIFDFDFLGHGWLIYDIMTFWQNLVLEVHYGRMAEAESVRCFRLFIGAYRELRAISDEELQTLPYLYPGFWLFYMGFHSTHDQFYEFVKPDALKFRTTVLRPIMEKILK